MAALAAAAAVFALAPPLDDVQMSIEGAGQVRGTRHAPVIELSDGRFSAEVAPNRGTRLQVHTEEATVPVIGTGFSVERVHFATEVAVRHGIVEVRCAGKAPVRLLAGQTQRCLPEGAATLLRRVVSLAAEDPDAALEAVDIGLRDEDAAVAVRAELMAQDVRLRASRDPAEAMRAARAYLETGQVARRAEMSAFVAGQRYAQEECGALGALEAAVAEDPGSVLAVALAGCVIDEDPERARALLDGVSEPGAWRAVRDALRERLGR
ncbi:MAG: FecR domain-containing protein [Myxococcota bacterium]